MVQTILSNHVMTSYINVNNCCNETKHLKQMSRDIMKHSHIHNVNARVVSELRINLYLEGFPMFFKHPVTSSACRSSEQKLLFIHHKFGNIKNAEKTELHSN